MKYLFDTDHVSILQSKRGRDFVVLEARVAAQPPDELAFSIVSFHEQVLGAHNVINRSRSAIHTTRGYELLSTILEAFAAVQVLPFDASGVAVYDDLRARRVRIATMDLRIAATALARGLILLTRNTRDFSQVPGLVTEDWTI
ncbi:MAG: type II toxin-antitoxin system VapC family toxin [Solirubrobacteraceae bacterium]